MKNLVILQPKNDEGITMFLNFFKHKHKEDVQLFYHTDVHSHILPGVDHGSQNIEQSLAMLQAEKAMGIERVMCTSHVTAETFENTRASLRAAGETLQKAIDEAGLGIEIHPTAEYRIDEYFEKEYAADDLLPMPGNYLLVENSFLQELISIDTLMFDLQCKGFHPILAHPERYTYYHERHDRYESLHSKGVKFQVNLLSLAGYYGHRVREQALWLIDHNLCDMLGSDMHGMEHARIIQEYLRSKDWNKLSFTLRNHIINDIVR